jgi:hypothetical protein
MFDMTAKPRSGSAMMGGEDDLGLAWDAAERYAVAS